MYIEDLSTEPREPSAANIWARELERDYPGLVTRSVGWLGATVPTSGLVDPGILAALRHYASWARVEDGWMGVHTCEICNAFCSNGEFWIIWSGIRYVLPQMTLHYITEHGYEPPEQFLKLAGADRSKGNGVFAPWRAPTVVHYSCAGWRVARSLSAIR